MTNMQAAIGLAQLEKLDEHVEKKREIGTQYQELLQGIPGIQLPQPKTEYADNIYWVFGIVLNQSIGIGAAETMSRLTEKQVGSRPFFWPLHQQPVFNKRGLFASESYPAAEHLATNGFYVPSGLGLVPENVRDVTEVIKLIVR